MKTLKVTLTIILFICNTFLQAQSKKKPIVAAEKISFIISLIGKNIEDATLEINDRLSPLGINFTKVTEEKDFVYNENLLPTENVYSYFKYLSTDQNFYITLIADSDKNIIKCNFKFQDSTRTLRQKIEGILGKPNTLVFQDVHTQIYRQKNIIYTTNKDDIQVFNNVEPVFTKPSSDSIKFGISMEDVGYNFNKILTENNNPILYAEKKTVTNDSKYQFKSFNQNIFYKNGYLLTLKFDQRKNTTAIIENPNAIYMSNIANKITSNGYQSIYGSESGYYKKEESFILKNDHYLFFYTIPNDLEKKLSYADLPSITELNDFYYPIFNDYSKRAEYLDDHYVKQGNFWARKNANGDVVRFYFGNVKDFNENRGLKFLVDSPKANINEFYKINSPNNLAFDDYDMNDAQFPERTQFYDKTLYSAAEAGAKAKQYANQLAQKKLETENKQREIIREQEKARKASENAVLINTATNSIINSLNTILK